MKSRKVLFIGTLIVAFLFVLSGCGSGGNEGDSSDQSAAAEESVAAQAETVEQVVTEQIAEAVDTQATVDELVGEWVDIVEADRFVKISKEGTEYQYEDNEGKLSATFDNGVLKVKVSDSETADVYIDTDSGHLLLSYQDNISEYAKK